MFSRHSRWLVVTLVAMGFLLLASLTWASPPASAPSDAAGNADTVDGFHAVASSAGAAARANKLLAAGSKGKFPMGVLPRSQLDKRYVNETGGKNIDIPVHGHAWVAERPANLLWIPVGWGTQAKRTAGAGQEWFHISIPFPSAMFGNAVDVTYVQFCYKTSDVATYVNRFEIYDDDSLVWGGNLSAPADTGYHCYSHTFSPAQWFEAVGVTVRGTFADNTDFITLGKAWARGVLR